MTMAPVSVGRMMRRDYGTGYPDAGGDGRGEVGKRGSPLVEKDAHP
jgi:hypothetical protein